MIELFHVTKRYPRLERPALDDVSASVARGDFVFLSGPSGAGKSTFLRLILAAERPTFGQVLVNNVNTAYLTRRATSMLRRDVGFVFQDFKLLPNRTVEENVALRLHVVGFGTSEIRARVTRMLKAVDLAHRARAMPQTLSGGEQQRVAIARALVNDPSILLADEPTGNLDAALTEGIMALLFKANARGTTVVVATHDLALMNRYKKRVIHLEAGCIDAGWSPPPMSS